MIIAADCSVQKAVNAEYFIFAMKDINALCLVIPSVTTINVSCPGCLDCLLEMSANVHKADR